MLSRNLYKLYVSRIDKGVESGNIGFGRIDMCIFHVMTCQKDVKWYDALDDFRMSTDMRNNRQMCGLTMVNISNIERKFEDNRSRGVKEASEVIKRYLKTLAYGDEKF